MQSASGSRVGGGISNDRYRGLYNKRIASRVGLPLALSGLLAFGGCSGKEEAAPIISHVERALVSPGVRQVAVAKANAATSLV